MKTMSLNYTSSYNRCFLNKAKMDLDIQVVCPSIQTRTCNSQFPLAEMFLRHFNKGTLPLTKSRPSSGFSFPNNQELYYIIEYNSLLLLSLAMLVLLAWSFDIYSLHFICLESSTNYLKIFSSIMDSLELSQDQSSHAEIDIFVN